MKTVLISSFHTLISRNILATDFFARLTNDKDVRVVLVVPNFKKEHFESRFATTNVFVRGVAPYQASRTFRGLLFKRLSMLLFSTETTRYKFKYKYYWDKKVLFYYLSVVIGFVGRSMSIRRIVRTLDLAFSPKNLFGDIFEEFSPDILLATDIQNENDVALMQDARRHKVPVLGMLRSWDNPTQRILRVWPDKLLVGSKRLCEETILYYDFPSEKIEIVGHPHYDRYLVGPSMGRSEFLTKFNLDPEKKLIFFAPGGIKIIKHDDIDEYIMKILAEQNMNVLVRFQLGEDIPLNNFTLPKHMAIDKPGVRFSRGESELTAEDEQNLINALQYADIVVTGPTSICLDAALLDKPVIAANCYPTERNQFEKVWGYPLSHIRTLLETGGVDYVETKDAFVKSLARYAKNPKLDSEGRARIRSLWFTHADGKSNDRLYGAVRNFLNTNVA